MEVERHKTALHRKDLSKPVRLAINDNLLEEGGRVFDYGCGRGGDVTRLRELGFNCDGWDPVYSPSVEKTPADLVNLGYVINVIENERERREVLTSAWDLAERVLVVSARLTDEVRANEHQEYNDGVLTQRGTFQRFFDQTELRNWIDSVLETKCVGSFTSLPMKRSVRLLSPLVTGGGRHFPGLEKANSYSNNTKTFSNRLWSSYPTAVAFQRRMNLQMLFR